MAHRLDPPEGRPYLDPEEVVRRLRDEFAHCEADADQGADIVGDMVAKLIELNAPQQIIDTAMAGRDRSLRVTVADDALSDVYLSFVVRPGAGLLIGYYSGRHEVAARPVLERCARALGYDATVV